MMPTIVACRVTFKNDGSISSLAHSKLQTVEGDEKQEPQRGVMFSPAKEVTGKEGQKRSSPIGA